MESTRSAFVEFLPSLIAGLANAEQPDNAVVVFDHFLQALQAGASAYVLKDTEPPALISSIIAVHAGQRVVTGTAGESRQFLGPWANTLLTFADPDRIAVKSFGLERLPQ